MNRELKPMLTEMLAWFHRVCTRNGLRYYVLGGTMLGAVRHQGFIPWDDDIDVGMPREDYIRLERILSRCPDPRYRLETPNSSVEDFWYPFAKLYDTRTTLVENTRYQTRRGIYLDIFPLDGAGNSRWEAKAHFAPIKWRRKLLLAMTTGIRTGRSLPKNLAVCVLRCLPEWLVDKKKLLHVIDRRSAGLAYGDCSWVGNMMGAWMERELMPKAILGTPREYVFEGLTIWGPEDFEGYLTSLYGNWRELPPVEQRKSRHDFGYMDLERSYLER